MFQSAARLLLQLESPSQQCCGSGMFFPYSNFSIPDSGSRVKKVFFTQKLFLSFWKHDPGCSSRIRILIFYPSRIPHQGVKKASDPGSGSASSQKHWLGIRRSKWVSGSWSEISVLQVLQRVRGRRPDRGREAGCVRPLQPRQHLLHELHHSGEVFSSFPCCGSLNIPNRIRILGSRKLNDQQYR